jgi:type VI secretion system protein ImpL
VSALLQKKPGESADTLQQAQAWLDYIKDLKALPVASMSSKQIADAYAGCFTVYSESDSEGDKQKSPFVKCHESANVLLAMMNITQEKSTGEELVTGLLTAPLQYILLYASDETANYLQKTWQESVLAEASQFELSKITRKLFSEQGGTVWKFVNGAALPFLQNTPEGYTERSDFMGNRIRFSDQFIAFLNKGMLIPVETQPFYPVVLGTLPSRSNTGAKIHPVSVKLEVSNTDKPFVLNNFNYPMQGTLNWSPDTCGRTSLTITFREFALQKIYEGNLGFVRFLEDFSNGTHIFKAEEFPDKQPILDKNGITSIKVSYRITGEEKIMRIINSMPVSLPETIVERMEE